MRGLLDKDMARWVMAGLGIGAVLGLFFGGATALLTHHPNDVIVGMMITAGIGVIIGLIGGAITWGIQL